RKMQKREWHGAVNQLVSRDILIQDTILDPPRIRPKQVRQADLIAGPRLILAARNTRGRASKAADILYYLAHSKDPIPAVDTVLAETGAKDNHLQQLVDEGLVAVSPAEEIVAPAGHRDEAPAELQPLLRRLPLPREVLDEESLEALQAAGVVYLVQQPATVSLAVRPRTVAGHIFRLRQATTYQAVLDCLAAAAQPVELSEIYRETGANISHLRKLAKADLIRFGSEEVWRDPVADREFTPS